MALLFLVQQVWGQLLTLKRRDEHIPIFDQIFDELIRPLQLEFMAFQALSEIRTIQERITEFQSRESHLTESV